MKIIVDNNLWISFIIGKRLSLLSYLLHSADIEIFICDELISEFLSVTERTKIKKYVSKKDVTDTLLLMKSYCKYVRITKKALSDIRDKNDIYLLSLAETIKADYIITGDKDLLVLKKHKQTKILSFSDFRMEIEKRV